MASSAQRPRKISPKPKRYRNAVLATLIPVGIALLLALAGAIFDPIGIHIGSHTLPYWVLILIGFSPYYLASITKVGSGYFYGIYVLELPAIEGESGWKYVPLGLARIAQWPREEAQEQFPGEPEQIAQVADDVADKMRLNMLRPIRITTGGPEQGEYATEFKGSILNEQITFDPTFTVTWQVELDTNPLDDNEGFFEFDMNIPGETWSEKYYSILKRMRDTGETELGIIMSKHSGAWCIKYREKVIESLTTKIAEAVINWGIIVCRVEVQNITGSHAVNTALGKIPEAKAEAEAAAITAQGQADARIIASKANKAATVTESEGQAQALENLREAEGKGERKAADALGMKPEDYRAGELAKTIIGDKTVIIGEDGIAKALAIGKTILKGSTDA